MNTTPKIRNDLKASSAEDQGIKYFDVADPRSGARMRLYDFEWLVAARMDGARHFDEVASWARHELGIQPSVRDLEEYAARLGDLGFFELRQEQDEDLTPLPSAMPGMRQDESAAGNDDPDIQVETEMPETPPAPTHAPSHNEPTGKLPPRPEAVAHSPKRSSKASFPIPVASTPSTTSDRLAVPPPKTGGLSGSLIALAILLVLGGAGIAYYEFFMGPQPTKVSVVVVSPREVVRLYDGVGAVNRVEPQTLVFAAAGKVARVVERGAQVKASEAVARLEGFEKFEKDLIDVKDRLGFYEKQLAAAQARRDENAAKIAEGKVAEKKKILGELEGKAQKTRLITPASGTVAAVMVKVGDDVKPGTPAVKIGDNRQTVEFKLAPGETAPRAGAPVTMQPAAGGGAISGRVIRADGGLVVVELADGALKGGESLRLVKAKIPNVVPVPTSALLKREGGDVVFVLSNGKAAARKVTLADRTAKEALVASGLAAGDSVIISGAAELTDGEPASTQ